MSCTCSTSALGDVFGERTARLDARRFRRRGLSRRGDVLIDTLRAACPFAGTTVLEGGAGIGGLSIELLRRGVSRAVAVDAVPAAVRTARTLAEEYGVAPRFEARVADFAALPTDEEPSDFVILDRVVCCFPDWQSLLGVAVARSRSVIGLTYPPQEWWSRLFVRCANFGMHVMRKDFRTHVHPPRQMHAFLREHGFEVFRIERVGVWELCVLRRTTS